MYQQQSEPHNPLQCVAPAPPGHHTKAVSQLRSRPLGWTRSMKVRPSQTAKAEPKAGRAALTRRSGLRSVSGLRNKPLTPFSLRDHAPILSPSNPDSCGSNWTVEEKYGARNHRCICLLEEWERIRRWSRRVKRQRGRWLSVN